MSNQETVISIQNVSKIYKLYSKPSDRLKEALHPFGKKYHTDFYALNQINFQVYKGETLGIIGKNGSGKSTLLKLITGVLTPTTGSIRVNGKISALLELGAGFNPEYTGIENIYFHGLINGFTKEQMDERLDEILSFADIGDFIHQPVKMYSSGMFVRLAFAVAINVEPDILIIDEALSVGDMRFQQKCFRKIEEFKKNKTILFVSHDMAAVNAYCDRAIWLNEGVIQGQGLPDELAKQYRAYMIGSQLSSYMGLPSSEVNSSTEDPMATDPISRNVDIHGDGRATIIGMAIYNYKKQEKTTLLRSDEKISLLIKIQSHSEIDSPIIGFTIKDRLGNIVLQCNSYVLNKKLKALHKNETAVFAFTFQIPHLNQGQYSISPAIASGTQDSHTQHCWIHDALIFNVVHKQTPHLEGLLVLNEVDFEQIV
jgi:ABC-type polysaccharide/polyol phosphate transport system ATPase subunit